MNKHLVVSAITLLFAGYLACADGLRGSPGSPPGQDSTQEAAAVDEEPVPPEPPPPPPINERDTRARCLQLVDNSLRDPRPLARNEALVAIDDLDHRDRLPDVQAIAERDIDAGVRARAFQVLGQLGERELLALLQQRHANAEPGERIAIDHAILRLADHRDEKLARKARKRLLKMAQNDDIGLALSAAMALADIAKPGDKEVRQKLAWLHSYERDVIDADPSAPLVIMAMEARLGDEQARDRLYELLKHNDEATRLAAAEALARIGDSEGRDTLTYIMDDGTSNNRIPAAAILVSFGEYGGVNLLADALTSTDFKRRRLAAKALGVVGERAHLRELLKLLEDDSPSVRMAAATAALLILDFRPELLARESVDWARQALDSKDWAVRAAVARTLDDLPDEASLSLFHQVSVDESPEVRKAAAESAARMVRPEVFESLATTMVLEDDAAVKEAQIRALSNSPDESEEVTKALQEVADPTAPLGILAIGSLIAVGEDSQVERLDQALDQAVTSGRAKLRALVMDAAMLAKNTQVIPTLKRGLLDRVFQVRFTAARGLAQYKADDAQTEPVLREGMESDDDSVRALALRALAQLQVPANVQDEALELIEEPEPETRAVALDVAAELDWGMAEPILLRGLRDSDPAVQRKAMDNLARFADSHKSEVVRLIRTNTVVSNPELKAQAQAKLARWMPPVEKRPSAPKPSEDADTVEDGEDGDAGVPIVEEPELPPVDTSEIRASARATERAHERFVAKLDKLNELLDSVDALVSRPVVEIEAADVQSARMFPKQLKRAQARMVAAMGVVGEHADTAADRARVAMEGRAGDADVQALVDAAAARSRDAQERGRQARARVTRTLDGIRRFISGYNSDRIQLLLTSAEESVREGRLEEARRELKKARVQAERHDEVSPRLWNVTGYYLHALAETRKGKRKVRDLKEARAAYQQVVDMAVAEMADEAQARIDEIDDALGEKKGDDKR